MTSPSTRPLPPRGFAMTGAVVVLALSAVACGGDDGDTAGPNGAALRDPFEEVAESMYVASDLDRDDDYHRGATLEAGACPVLDDEALVALGEAAGTDRFADSGDPYVTGMPDDEFLICTLVDDAGQKRLVVSTGTTRSTPEQFERQQLSFGDDLSTVEVAVPGVDESHVIAVGNDDLTRAVWIGDDFFISVGGDYEPEELGDLLGVAVDAVPRVLVPED